MKLTLFFRFIVIAFITHNQSISLEAFQCNEMKVLTSFTPSRVGIKPIIQPRETAIAISPFRVHHTQTLETHKDHITKDNSAYRYGSTVIVINAHEQPKHTNQARSHQIHFLSLTLHVKSTFRALSLELSFVKKYKPIRELRVSALCFYYALYIYRYIHLLKGTIFIYTQSAIYKQTQPQHILVYTRSSVTHLPNYYQHHVSFSDVIAPHIQPDLKLTQQLSHIQQNKE